MDIRDKLLGYIPRIGEEGLDPEEFGEEFGQDLEHWKTVVARETGIDLDQLQEENQVSDLGYQVMTEEDMQRLNPAVREKISEFPLGYHSGSNTVLVNFPVMEQVIEQEGSLPAHFYGEEIAHWLREELNPESYNLSTQDIMSLDPQQQEILADTIGEDTYTPDPTVNEFFGRTGSRIVSEAAGEEPENLPENPRNMIGKDYTGSPDHDITLEEYRELLMGKDQQELRPDDPIIEMQQFIAHHAGYRAADEQLDRILEDDQIFYREDQEIRERYNLGEYENQALREMMDDEILDDLEQQ
jgi:hypothetical protein